MSAFEGIDPVQEQAIRRALKKEIRGELTEELSEDIRRKVERDVQAETRREVLQEIAERTPTDEERETFSAYVREVRLDAYAQGTMASEIAETALAESDRSKRVTSPLLVLLVVALPNVVAFSVKRLGGWGSSGFIAATATIVLCLIVLWLTSMRRHFRLDQRHRTHAKIASDFLIIAERAKAFAMVHAERLASTGELHEVLEGLRRDKERQDRAFHPSASALENARAAVGPRIAEENRRRIAIDPDGPDDEERAPAVRKRLVKKRRGAR